MKYWGSILVAVWIGVIIGRFIGPYTRPAVIDLEPEATATALTYGDIKNHPYLLTKNAKCPKGYRSLGHPYTTGDNDWLVCDPVEKP